MVFLLSYLFAFPCGGRTFTSDKTRQDTKQAGACYIFDEGDSTFEVDTAAADGDDDEDGKGISCV